MAGRKNSNRSGKQAAKAKTTPAAGTKRKADEMTTGVAPPAPVATAPPPFADGPSAAPPSAAPPSASPQVAWPGLPEPKRFHYDTDVAVSPHNFPCVSKEKSLTVLTIQFLEAKAAWCKREQVRLSARIETVTKLCRDDADSINTMNDEIATLRQQDAEEAVGASSEDFLQANLNKKREERAAAKAEAEAEGVVPDTANSIKTTSLLATDE
ncbi:hypothetical protein FAGAP_5039 [Fusarium agapanthi]|uniref:Uncharacterized protein n=1 Tax=Fusarium agapanthi TaxID=1803897 RepID=A0A9P5E7A3_9HYPO|nr:hypothetical protein FAGAP_5039 [Fusarium agapanthi]